MHIVLKTMPLSTNQLYRPYGGRIQLSAKGRENKEAMGWEAREQYRGMPLEGSLFVTVALYWGNLRNHDLDNIKSLLDALNGILWLDDGQIQELRISKFYDKHNPHVELEVTETY